MNSNTHTGLQLLRTCILLFILMLCANTSVYSLDIVQSDEICETLPTKPFDKDQEEKEDAELEGEKELVHNRFAYITVIPKTSTVHLILPPEKRYTECFLGVSSPPPELD